MGHTDREERVIFNDNDSSLPGPGRDCHRYFEFEMNALNTVWNLFLDRPYKHKGTPQVREMPARVAASSSRDPQRLV